MSHPTNRPIYRYYNRRTCLTSGSQKASDAKSKEATWKSKYLWGNETAEGFVNHNRAPRPRRGHSLVAFKAPQNSLFLGKSLVVMFGGRDNDALVEHIPKTYNVTRSTEPSSSPPTRTDPSTRASTSRASITWSQSARSCARQRTPTTRWSTSAPTTTTSGLTFCVSVATLPRPRPSAFGTAHASTADG